MVDQFQGQYRFLSNFWIEKDGSTVEHEFQAAKTKSTIERRAVMEAPTPGQAKKMGRLVTLRADWDAIKLDVMNWYVYKKFLDDPDLAAKLLATGDEPLFEGNWWHDTFWGVDLKTGEGQNHLGITLQNVRQELRDAG